MEPRDRPAAVAVMLVEQQQQLAAMNAASMTAAVESCGCCGNGVAAELEHSDMVVAMTGARVEW